MSLVIAVDVGQTGARVRMVAPVGSRELRVSGHTVGVSVSETVGRVLAAAADAWGAHLVVECLSLGLTGVHGGVPSAGVLRGVLPGGWDVATIRAIDDSLAAHLAAFAGGPGTSVVVGTGVAALAWGGHGPWVHGDGRGPLLGDRGGGFWIGLTGIRSATRALDGAGPPTDLVDRVRDRFGPPTGWSRILVWDPVLVPSIAGFCIDVLAVARYGDVVAMGVIRDAAEELARTTVAAAQRAGIGDGGMECSMVGKVANARDLITDPWAARIRQLDPQLRAIDAVREPLDALVELASQPIPVAVERLVGQA